MDLSKIDNDFTNEEAERVNVYVQNGCIGLHDLVKDEAKVNSMFSLYMSGKTYAEISRITRTKKDIVLYMSAKMRWYKKRMEYLNEIQNKMTNKISETRVESLNFITNLINFHHKYYGDKIDKYLRTNDDSVVEDIDLKMLNHYFKSIEALEKVVNPANVKKGGSNTTININATDGAKVEQLDDNTVEITPGTTGDLLKKLSELKDSKRNSDK